MAEPSLFEQGNAAFRRSLFVEAVELFSRALAAQPEDERVWSNRCAAYLRLEQLDAAEADARRCVELAPRWHKGHFRVGRVQQDRGELVDAWESYYAAHVLEPEAPLYAQMMASVDAQLSEADAPAEALEALRALKLRILQVDPMAALTAGDPSKRVPVTVLSGFLGAGKTSLLRHVLSERHGLRVAVIVNDMAELNIDGELVRAAGASLVRAEDRLVEMSNGCICCTLREDLLSEVATLCLSGRFDAMLIESSGISEPTPVAQTFLFEDLLGRSLSHLARLDTMVTVVDAQRFALDAQSGESLQQRGISAKAGDARGIGTLLVSQSECADVFLLNKADLVSEEHLKALGAQLRALNASAKQIVSVHGRVPVERVLKTGLFNWAQVMQAPSWLRELSSSSHASESESYGVSSFLYRRARSFDGARLEQLLLDRKAAAHCLHASRLLRSKGFWWMRQAPALRLEWATAAADFVPRVVGVWLGALAEMAKADPALVAAVSAHTQWDANYADRKVEIVFIGVELDRKAVEAALDWALLTDAEDAQLRAAGLFACPPSARTGAFAELLAPALAQLEQCPDDAGHEHSHAHSHAHAHAEDGACASRGLPSKSDVEEMLRQTLAPSDDEEEPKAAEDAQEDANMIEPH